MAKRRRRKRKKKLNTKVAVIGVIILVGLMIGAVVVVRGKKEDPMQLLGEAETALVEIEDQISAYKQLRAAGESEATLLALDEGKSAFGSIGTLFGRAYKAAEENEQLKIDILFRLADYYAIDNVFHEGDWQKIRGTWGNVLNVDPKNIKAMKKQLEYVYVMADGGIDNAWAAVELNASDLDKVMSEQFMEPDAYVLRAKARALLKIADMGQATDLGEAITDAEQALDDLRRLTPDDPDVYEYLAEAAEVRGEIESSEGSRDAAQKAVQEAQKYREEALEVANDNPVSHINFLAMRLNYASGDKEKIRALEADYKSLAARFISAPKAHAALSSYYIKADISKTDKAIDAIVTAVQLDPENAKYAITAAGLYHRKYAFYDDNAAFEKAIETASKALLLDNAQTVKGPKRRTNMINRYSLYSQLAKWYVEEAVKARLAENEQVYQNWLTKAEEAAHQIKQIMGSDEGMQAVKWDGILEYARGNDTEAVQKLYEVYTQLNATGKSDSLVSYTLALIFEGRPEIGSRAEFMQSAISASPSIVVTKPEALLDFAEVVHEMKLFASAISWVDAYERLFSHNARCDEIRLKGYIGAGMSEEAEELISKMKQDDAQTMALKVDLINRYIAQNLQDQDRKQFGKDEEAVEKSLSQLKAELTEYKNELVRTVDTLLKENSELVNFAVIRAICDGHYLKEGKTDQAIDLVSRFIAHYPEKANARTYMLMLQEPDPINISKQRRNEITEASLKEISDDIVRTTALALHYQRAEELDKAISILQNARKQWPSDKSLIATLFDIALAKEDFALAAELVDIARSENADDCNGEFFAARVNMAKEEYQDALLKFDNCLKIRPIFPYVYYLKSIVYNSLERYDESVENAALASTMNPMDKALATQNAYANYTRNLKSDKTLSTEVINETERTLLRAIGLNAGDLQLRGIYAEFMSVREPIKALSMLQQLQNRNPNVENSILLGNMAVKISKETGDNNQKDALLAVAGDAYQKAFEIEPGNPKVIESYSEYLRVTDRQAEAEALFKGHDASIWKFYYRDGQYSKASEILLGLYNKDPEDTAIVKGLALTAQKTLDASTLKKYSERLIELDPSTDNELLQIQMYLEAGLATDADLKLASFRERNPEEARGILMEAWVKMIMGDLRKSLELLNHSLEIDTDSAMAWRLRGQVNSLLGDYSEAINNLKKSKAVEDSSDIRIDLARAYNRAGRTTEAISEVTLAIKEGQAPLSARTMLETLYKDAGRKSDLKKFYRVTIEKYPDEVFWYFRAGVFYSEEQEYDTAAKLFEQSWEISQKTTANAECLNKYLDTLWMSGKYQDLMSYASQYIDTPFAPIAYAQMAKTEVKLNNLQTAKQHYYKALDKSASNPALLSGILDNMTKTLGAEEVEKYCDQKLAVEPDSLVANLTMFNLSQQTGQFNKALGYVDKLLKVVGPENPSWLLYTARRADTLVLAYMKTSDRQYMDQAVEAYEALLVKVPNNATALNNLAYLLADADDQLDKAAQYARRACQASPNDASKLDTYAYILCKTEKYEEAEKLLQTAIQLFEKSSTVIPWDIYEHLGMAQEGLGQKSKAVASYRRSLQIAGDEVSPKDRQELLDAIKRVSL